jgi:hypothetical protein
MHSLTASVEVTVQSMVPAGSTACVIVLGLNSQVFLLPVGTEPPRTLTNANEL